MKRMAKTILLGGILICSFTNVKSQEPAKITPDQTENQTKKGQNNNTVRSNRTNDKTMLNNSSGSGNNSEASSKKGYDYYKAQSDMSTSKTKDHNSSRSNKSSTANMNQNSVDSTQMKINQNSSRSYNK